MENTKTINIKLVIHFAGLVLLFESLFMIIDLMVCFIYDKSCITAITDSILITFSSGFLLFITTKKNIDKEPSRKDSFLIVTLSWLILSLYGVLPYILSFSIYKFTDALFETVSGFTTTGSSILTNVENIPKGILFWRSETHWIGGMGIILLMLAIFPYFKIGGTQEPRTPYRAYLRFLFRTRIIES